MRRHLTIAAIWASFAAFHPAAASTTLYDSAVTGSAGWTVNAADELGDGQISGWLGGDSPVYGGGVASLSLNWSGISTVATLTLTVLSLNTLDGFITPQADETWSDLLTITINGVKAFSGYLNMNGSPQSGVDKVLTNTGTYSVDTSTQSASFAFAMLLTSGSNTISVSYDALEAISNEAWRVSDVRIAVVPGPIAGAGLPALALLGLGWSRRRRSRARCQLWRRPHPAARSARRGLAVAAVVALAMVSAGVTKASAATEIAWATWTSSSASTVIGSIGALLVTYTGLYDFAQTLNTGNDYWTDTGYTQGLVNRPPTTDIIGLNEGGEKAITFSSAVTAVYMAFTSWNGNTVTFSSPFTIVAQGCGVWGCGTFDVTSPDGFVGDGDVHGVLKFAGPIISLTFTDTTEGWHGFTVGLAVPGPIAGAGLPALLAVAGWAWRRRIRPAFA